MIVIISFLSSWCGHHKNGFPWCTTFQFEIRYDYLIKFYFPPTHFFREKLLLKKCSVFSNKNLAFGSVIEGVPNCFFRVSYEDALLRFGFELIRLKPFDISVATPNFKKRQLRFVTKPEFIRCRLKGFRRCPI